MEKVIVITGPTAVGKTEVSLTLAKKYGFDIVNGDAFQIYKDMNIGTAKPSLEERKVVAHHLFDILEPTDSFSICDYQKLVRQKIEEQVANDKVPLIVGGSGLYINSVIYDYQFDTKARSNEFSKRFENLTDTELFNELVKVNPNLASTLHPNNRKRVERALEITLEGDNINRNNQDVLVYDSCVIFLYNERSILYDRINTRVDLMVNQGLFEEVESLYPTRLGPQAASAIGYKEVIDYLDGKCSKEEAIELIKQHTRNYAKRQITWFKNKTNAIWINVHEKSFQKVMEELENIISNFLKKEV